MSLAGATLNFAGGGNASGNGNGYQFFGLGGIPNTSAPLFGFGAFADFSGGGSAFGASFCPNGPSTGKGGNVLEGGQHGYVVLTW